MKQTSVSSRPAAMSCEAAQRAIALVAAAGAEPLAEPLPENDMLAAHLSDCRACQAEMSAALEFFRTFAGGAGPEPSPALLARSRQQLDSRLDACAEAGLLGRLHRQAAFTAGRLRAMPLLASGLLLLGISAGAYGGFQAGRAVHTAEQTALLLAPPPPEAPSIVADVSGIRQDPETGMVEVHYDRLVPDVLAAPAGDPSIRELLTVAAENGVSPEVRDLSVSLLNPACAPGSPCAAAPARAALLHALAEDQAPEVRREALVRLQPWIADDLDVRDAVLGALMGDPSASVRAEAVRVLQPVEVDSSVRQALHTVAFRDGDPGIRSASLAALKAVPQLQ